MSTRRIACVLLLVLAGCGQTAPQNLAQKSSPDHVTDAELNRFLDVLDSKSHSLIPEFTPPEDEEPLDHNRPAVELAAEFRTRFRTLFDEARQAEVWETDDRWAAAFRREKISGVEFAALVRHVSCSVMRVRIDARVKIDRLISNAQAEVDELIATIDAIDEVPEEQRSRQDHSIRTSSVFRLARMVALLEFATMVQKVPAENCALVRKYSRQLKPLLPQTGTEELLAELQLLGAPRSSPVQHASYSEPADSP